MKHRLHLSRTKHATSYLPRSPDRDRAGGHEFAGLGGGPPVNAPRTVHYDLSDLLYKPGGKTGLDSAEEVVRVMIDCTGGQHWSARRKGAGTIEIMSRYEPFFDDSHDFRFGRKVGVSPILVYDPVGRVVATINADHTFEKIVFDPWRVENWDANDTTLADPNADADLGGFLRAVPREDLRPTWYEQRINGALGETALDAARKAAAHAGTPSVTFADALGRPFLLVTHNRAHGPDCRPRDEVGHRDHQPRPDPGARPSSLP